MSTDAAAIGGMGHSVKRKEDARFLRGKGRYIDDIKLPGMIYMDIVRSPYAHAMITKIDASKALALAGRLAVITGKDLDAAGLAWMPTLMGDKQMVLPVDRGVYQAQEGAAGNASARYIAADGVQLVEVEYDPLPPVVDPFKAMQPDSPLVRPDREQTTNHISHWEAGDAAQTDVDFLNAEVVVKEGLYIPRIHVCSIEPCGCVASFDKV